MQTSDVIKDAVTSCNLYLLNNLTVQNFDLAAYIKQALEQFQSLTKIIIDLSALNKKDDEICLALENFRMVCSNVQIIIISPERKAGDSLLSQIFGLGIYDIISCDSYEEIEDLKVEIMKCLTEGKTYKDSAVFKDTTTISQDKAKNVKEKIIIKREIQKTVEKALIGFMGTEKRIGVTHNCIVSANYLSEKGYKVAVVENAEISEKTFASIKNDFDGNIEHDGYFSIGDIDYYPNYDLAEIYKIVAKNYNFVCVDFGTINNKYLIEFSRCVVQVIVTGSKPWELESINQLFEMCSEEELKNFTYLFNFTDTKQMQLIQEGMGNLKKIFFAPYTPDPFIKMDGDSSEVFDSIFKEYAGTSSKEEKKSSLGVWKKINEIFQK